MSVKPYSNLIVFLRGILGHHQKHVGYDSGCSDSNPINHLGSGNVYQCVRCDALRLAKIEEERNDNQ